MTAPACSRCQKRAPRDGLRTCEPCAQYVARRARLPRRARVPAAPPGFRIVPGMHLAIDRDGIVVLKHSAEGWREVDLAAASLVRRARPALADKAWRV